MKKLIITFVFFASIITISNAAHLPWNVYKEHGGIGGWFNRYSDVSQEYDHSETIGNVTYNYFNLRCCNPGWQICRVSTKSPQPPTPNDPLDYLWEKYDEMIVEKLNYCIDYADKSAIDNVLKGNGCVKVSVPELIELNSIFVFNFKWDYKDVENGKIYIDSFILKL